MLTSSRGSIRTLATVLALASLGACAADSTPDQEEAPSSSTTDDAATRFEEEIAGLPRLDRVEVFAQAETDGRLGTARKTRAVDARPAVAGETIATVIAGDGVETISEPATEGDMVVRNRCPETGNEEILVQAEKFPSRYGPAQTTPDSEGYAEYLPTGVESRYFELDDADGEFVMEAPWGEDMVYRPGDIVIQNPADETDVYRVYSESFACTYEVLSPATDER